MCFRRGESGGAVARSGGASRPTPPDYPHAVLMASQIYAIFTLVEGPDTRDATCQFIPLYPFLGSGMVIGSAAAQYPLERSTPCINAWGCMFRRVRARSGSRVFMLTAYGLEPVAPVRGRSEEEMVLCMLPVACPLVDLWPFPILCIARIGGLGFWNWF